MQEFYLSTSAFEYLGSESPEIGLFAVKAAHDYGFRGAQIHINEQLSESRETVENLRKAALRSNVELIARLPNMPTKKHVAATRELLGFQGRKSTVVPYPKMVETPDGVVDRFISKVRPHLKFSYLDIYLENTENGSDVKYLTQWSEEMVDSRYGSVLNVDKLFETKPGKQVDRSSVGLMLRSMIEGGSFPHVLHLVDKAEWSENGKAGERPFGAGVYKEFMDLIRRFEGPKVFGHQDLKNCVKSKNNVLAIEA